MSTHLAVTYCGNDRLKTYIPFGELALLFANCRSYELAALAIAAVYTLQNTTNIFEICSPGLRFYLRKGIDMINLEK